MSERMDFRINRLERRVFGTQTATAGTNSGALISSADVLTRLATLEATALSTPTFSVVATLPATTTGYKNGDEIWVTNEEMFYKVVSGAWVQRAS